MAEFVFQASTIIERPRDEVFEFFSRAENLEAITPPELNFHILTPLPIELQKGTLIDYSLSLHGIPIKWRTEITEWDPPYEFVDTQLSGPYKQWIHCHRFTEPERGKTLMEDEVRYRLPLEPLGDLVQFMISRQVAGIFSFREQVISKLFGSAKAPLSA
jgi:ligand-binding SRPBCC domain-containing protein